MKRGGEAEELAEPSSRKRNRGGRNGEDSKKRAKQSDQNAELKNLQSQVHGGIETEEKGRRTEKEVRNE